MKNFWLQFGGKATKAHKEQYQKSDHWSNRRFNNLQATNFSIPLKKIPLFIAKQSQIRKERPKHPLPVLPLDQTAFMAPTTQAQMIWYGHSVILMQIEGQTILIDPMLGANTTPIAPTANKRYTENTLDLINDFPEIDLLLLSHDHYDHLDFDSIQRLRKKTKRYAVALGVKRHLVKWGVDPDRIEELDWWQQTSLQNLSITFTPTQHFAGRGLRDRDLSFWGGWAIKSDKEHIWFSGDGGYGPHFKAIGDQLGPFDLAFMECGQYNDLWRVIHLFPEEAVQAAIDAKVKKAIPVHWGAFSLSFQHSWQEPPAAFIKAATAQNLDFAMPKLGQQFSKTLTQKDPWWEGF